MIFEKVKQLCDEKGVTIYRLEKDMEFSENSIVKWRTSIPSADKLFKVANYFDKPIEYFLESSKPANQEKTG